VPPANENGMADVETVSTSPEEPGPLAPNDSKPVTRESILAAFARNRVPPPPVAPQPRPVAPQPRPPERPVERRAEV
jgi:hypothetical protein